MTDTANYSTPSPCVGLCSTTYGDLVCFGCKRFATEVRAWTSADLPRKQAIWQRLSDLVTPLMAEYVIITNEQHLRDKAQQLQLRFYDPIPPLHIAWILLRKQLPLVAKKGIITFGLVWKVPYNNQSPFAVWDKLSDELKAKSIATLPQRLHSEVL